VQDDEPDLVLAQLKQQLEGVAPDAVITILHDTAINQDVQCGSGRLNMMPRRRGYACACVVVSHAASFRCLPAQPRAVAGAAGQPA
jgi:hypothetical protein